MQTARLTPESSTEPQESPPAPESAPSSSSSARLRELLDRPADQRLREYKYRFAQSVVFGMPVLALQWWGGALGPTDADRWVSLLQVLMCGWVLYVNLGMLVEGLLVPGLRLRGDFLIALIATALYSYSAVSALHGIITAHLWYRPLFFHACVLVLATWSAWRWWRMSRA